MQHNADCARWWDRLRLCPERGPVYGYRCDSYRNHPGPHQATWLIDAQDALYSQEDWEDRASFQEWQQRQIDRGVDIADGLLIDGSK